MRPAELHSPSAEENCMTENVASLRSVQGAAHLATLARLSLVDLPSANSIKCCSPPASLKVNKSEFIKENIDETIFMFALFKCRKSDKGRN